MTIVAKAALLKEFVRQHRGDHNRLGIAVLMSYLRFPGRVLAGDERPHGRVLDIVAGQLGIPVDMWEVYAERDATRRSHLLELLPRLGMEQFGTRHYRSIAAWLDPTALQTTRGVVLAQAVVEELRKRLIVLPPVAVIERLCGEATTRAQRKVFALLTEGLADEQRTKLDRLLEQREGSPYSMLAWLRMPPGAPTPRAVLGHIDRLIAIRDLSLPPDASQKLHQNRLLQLAREAGQTAVYQFKEYEQARRHGTLVALMIETAATLTDEIIDLNDRLIGSSLPSRRTSTSGRLPSKAKPSTTRFGSTQRSELRWSMPESKAAIRSQRSKRSCLGKVFRPA